MGEKRKQWVSEVKRLFSLADSDGSGYLTWHEFELQCENLDVQMCLKNLGVDVFASSPFTLFHLLDVDRNDRLEIDTLAEALMHLHGPARSVDMVDMRQKLGNVMKKVQACEAALRA